MQVSDDLFLGGFSAASGWPPNATGSQDPTVNQGAGPMGRTAYHNIVPLTKQVNNIALSQHTTAATGMVLTAGTGVTKVTDPRGTGGNFYQFDVPRCVSLTSAGGNNFSGVNFTITGLDLFNRVTTQTMVGPNGTTVNTTKAFKGVISIVPDTTDGTHNLSAGSADIFGLPYYMADAVYLIAKWANTLAVDAGTFVVGDATSPATALTGDPRGTYAPSSGSNGTNRLVVLMHINAGQCGPAATVTNLIGVTPV